MNNRRLSIHGNEAVLDGAAYFPDLKPKATVIICHGLPKGMPEPGDQDDPGYPGLAKEFVNRGYAAVIFNFRGTGESGGSLEIARWPDDLLSVIGHLENENGLSAKTYPVVGFSTGGAAAVFASAADGRIEPLITGAAPADFEFLYETEDVSFWFEHYKTIGMIRPEYKGDVQEWAENFTRLESKKAMPLSKAGNCLIIHGGMDDTVPVAHSKILSKAFPGRARLEILPNAGHQLRKESKAVNAIIDYLDQYYSGDQND